MYEWGTNDFQVVLGWPASNKEVVFEIALESQMEVHPRE